MEKNKIKNRCINYRKFFDNMAESLNIEMEYINNENIDIEKIIEIGDIYFENMDSFEDIKKVIIYIRALYKDFEEQHLNLKFARFKPNSDETQKYITINIHRGILTTIYLYEKIDKDISLIFTASGNKLNFEVNDRNTYELLNSKKYDEKIYEILNEIRSYLNINIKNNKELHDIYDMAFNENANLSEDNIKKNQKIIKK